MDRSTVKKCVQKHGETRFWVVQITFEDFQEFASLRKELHKLQVALEFYQKTTGRFTLNDLKVRDALYMMWRRRSWVSFALSM